MSSSLALSYLQTESESNRSLSFESRHNPLPPLELTDWRDASPLSPNIDIEPNQPDQAVQATTTSHDYPTAATTATPTPSSSLNTTRLRRASTVSSSPTAQEVRSKRVRAKSSALPVAVAFPALIPVDQQRQQSGTWTFPPSNRADSTPNAHHSLTINPASAPSRPHRSPLRPTLPSFNKRRRQDSSPTVGRNHRARGSSGLSVRGIDYLRNTLETFRQSLRSNTEVRPERNEAASTSEKQPSQPVTRQRLSSITLSGFFDPPHIAHSQKPSSTSSINMSLSDQRSTQRLIDELMEDLTPRSPTGSIGPPPPPLPLPRNVDRVRRAGGHRRTYSSPGSVSAKSGSVTSTGSGSGSKSDVRGRTLSGGTFGRALGSDGLLSDVETLRSGRWGNDGTASAPISPAVRSTPLPPVQLPLIAARSNRASEETSSPHSATALPPVPVVAPVPSDDLPSPPPLIPPTVQAVSSPLVIRSPPLVTPPDIGTNSTRIPSFQPVRTSTPSLPVPPTTHKSPHRTSKSSPSPEVHPFAAVVAMMEEGDSPSRRRSRLSEKSSEEVLNSPGTAEKGKQRHHDERPSVGRKQTPRRGFIGPGGIVPRMMSRASLAKLRGAQSSHLFPIRPSEPHPIIIPIPPSPPSTAPLPTGQYTRTGTNTPATPVTPDSTTYLRPAPATPLTPFWSKPRFAVSSARQPSPSPSSRQPTPTFTHAPRSGTVTSLGNGLEGLPQPGREEGLIEIPRFKTKELNLGIVRTRGPRQKAAWLCLWAIWVVNGMLSLFFDVNVIYILIQCATHPSFDTNSAKTWQFATAAYVVLWAISTLAVWLGWEVGYEFWRRWRLPRPAIEPIYLSLPAALHLSLISFNHFTFLLHIRSSPLNTPHSRDIIPETAHALLQLFPGLLPLLPRAAIAIVILISFWDPAANVTAPFGGSIDDKSSRDPRYFRSDSPGQLTGYAKGVCITFAIWVVLRLVIVVTSGVVVWSFSGRPLGGLIGHRFSRRKKLASSSREPPVTPRKPKSSLQVRDPSTTSSPQKSWVEQENEFNWAWRDRARARIQDGFELCMIRRSGRGLGSFLYQSEIPWGRIIDQRSTRSVPETGRYTQVQKPIEMQTPSQDPAKGRPVSTEDLIESSVEGHEKDGPGGQHTAPGQQTVTSSTNNEKITPESNSSGAKSKSDRARPESTLDPTSTTFAAGNLRPSNSRANTAASSSATDLFYTPMSGNTPQSEKTRSVAEGIHRLPPLPSEDEGRAAPPPSVYRPGGILHEFGVKEGLQNRGRDSPDSGSGEGEDESTGLLSASASVTASPRASILSRDRSASNASHIGSNDQSHSGSGTYSSAGGSGSGSGSGSRSSSKSRRRAYTTSSPGERLNRARSSSIGLLRESVANAAAAGGSLVRRARSGTMLSGTDSAEHGGYSRFEDVDKQSQPTKQREGDADEREEVLDIGQETPRSRRVTGLDKTSPFGKQD
ncbi:hypothetical protein IAU59_000747 [Kwoniella sp. CBS 9459]